MTDSSSIALLVAYDGEPFAGFARQPGLSTVQGRIEDALSVVLRHQIETTGAGRTDAGVHALGQVVSFETDAEVPSLRELRRSVDALVGEGIVVREAMRARSGFSARFDALSREYRYRIVDGSAPPLFLRAFAWHITRQLDTDTMAQAARSLLGEHDFRSFCVSESAQGKTTMRRLDTVEVSEQQHLGERCIEIRVIGNAFLHSMVRVIVGTLVEVGAGRRDVGWVAQALETRRRDAAGPTAPAQGLTLWRVEYPEDSWEREGQ